MLLTNPSSPDPTAGLTPVPRTDLGVVAHGSRQQREGVLHRDPPLDNVLAQALQVVLAVGRGQIQQPWRSTRTGQTQLSEGGLTVWEG